MGPSRRPGKATLGGLLVLTAAVAALLAAGVPNAKPSFGVTSAVRPTVPAPTTTTPAPPPPPTTTTTAPPPPTTTTTAPPAKAVVTTTPPPPPPPAAPPATARQGIIPPAEPPANIPPSPDFLQNCQGNTYDDSPGCVNAALSAIANGRAHEGLPPMTLPSNWTQLTAQQQIFVVTNLERTVRGLPPLAGMVDALDQAAAQGAAQGVDPSPPGGYPATQWGSNWAGAVGNPLEADYYWMYDDGLGSSNIDCTQSNQSGCWGHRDNALLNLTCQMCVMGTGYNSSGWQGDPSMAELLVDSRGQPALAFSWQQEQAYL